MIGFNWIFLFEAYHYTSVSVATLSYYFAPVIVMAACPCFFGRALAETDNLFCVFNGRPRSCDILRRPGGRQQQYHGSWLRTGGRGFKYACIILINKSLTGIDGIDRTLAAVSGRTDCHVSLCSVQIRFPCNGSGER